MFTSNYIAISKAKLEKRDFELDSFATLFANDDDSLEKEILSSDAKEIVQKIESKRFTATLVLKAFIRAAIKTSKLSNPITEVLFAPALERARELDGSFLKTGKLVGPLHGIPISLKDQINVEGFDSSIGFSAQCNQVATSNSTIYEVLVAAGGNPFVKSTVPQTLLSFESSNKVFGTCTNPYDATRTPGGSSSGEGCLLLTSGSALGIGSDIGGSLRIPAHYCGIYSLKPTYGRFPSGNIVSPSPGFQSIVSTLGPMGRSVDDLELACRVVFDASESLASIGEDVIPIPFREVDLPKKLKIGYYYTDGFCRSSPASRRAIDESVKSMENLGHSCVLFEPISPIDAMEIFVALTSAGGYKKLLAGLQGDPQEPALFLTTLGVKIPSIVRSIASQVVHSVIGDPQMSTIIAASRVKTVDEAQTWSKRKEVYVSRFKKDVWKDHAFDFIFCSTSAVPAVQTGATATLSPLAISTILWNVLDTAVGVVPITHVDMKKDAITEGWKKLDVPGSKLIEDRVYGFNDGSGGIYESMNGLPIGLSIVGPSFSEEKVLKVMKVLDEALGKNRGFAPNAFNTRGKE